MDPEAVQELLAYEQWAFERLWGCIHPLTDDQFIQEVDYSRGSIRNQVIHMISTTERWVARLQQAGMPARAVNEDYPDKASARSRWDEGWARTVAVLSAFSHAGLDEMIHWELPDRGLKCENRRWEIVLHMSNHGTDHRAQTLAMLNQYFGIETVEQDLILYLIDKQAKTVKE
jgi:uncharacterized damage-inducible protein DinB